MYLTFSRVCELLPSMYPELKFPFLLPVLLLFVSHFHLQLPEFPLIIALSRRLYCSIVPNLIQSQVFFIFSFLISLKFSISFFLTHSTLLVRSSSFRSVFDTISNMLCIFSCVALSISDCPALSYRSTFGSRSQSAFAQLQLSVGAPFLWLRTAS